MAFLDNLKRTQSGSALASSVREIATALGIASLLPDMSIGNFGDVVFTVSTDRAFTYNSYSRKTSINYSTHDIISASPVLEYTSPAVEEIALNIQLINTLGVDPFEECETLRKLAQDGRREYLFINGEPIGGTPWVITDLSEDATIFDTSGRPAVSTVALTFKKAPNIPVGGVANANYSTGSGNTGTI